MADVTAQELKAIFSGDATSYEAAVAKMNSANKRLLEGDNKVKNQIAGLARDLSLVNSPATAFAVTMDRLSETFKTGLGFSLATLGLAHLAQSVEKAREQTRLFYEEVNKLASQDTFAKGKSGGALLKDIEDARAAQDKLAKEGDRLEKKYDFSFSGFANALANPGEVLDYAGGGDKALANQSQFAAGKEADAKRQLVAYQKEYNKALEESSRTSDDSAMRELKFKEELYQAEKIHDQGYMDSIKERQQFERDIASYAVDKKLEQVDLEAKILQIQKDGVDVARRTSEARLASARKLETAALGKSGNADDAAKFGLAATAEENRLDKMNEDAFKESPRVRNARLSARRETLRKQAALDARRENQRGLTNVSRDMNGNVIGGIDPETGERRKVHGDVGGEADKAKRFNDLFDPAAREEAKRKRGADKEAADKAFKDQFKTKAQQAAEADANTPAAPEDAPADGTDKIVNKLDELKTSIDTAIMK